MIHEYGQSCNLFSLTIISFKNRIFHFFCSGSVMLRLNLKSDQISQKYIFIFLSPQIITSYSMAWVGILLLFVFIAI